MKSDRVVPVVIFLKDGKVPRRRLCLGIDGRSYLRFHYIARVLPRLPARRYFESDNIVARLNLVTMRHARKDRPVVYGQALKGLLALEANADKQRKYLDFIDMYLPLEDNEREVFERTYRQENERMGG
ncbi:MAG: hypothetical protein Q4D19_02045, partial [Lautropia sp.]|nr:hypothetical protein [Lautropia sp.]